MLTVNRAELRDVCFRIPEEIENSDSPYLSVALTSETGGDLQSLFALYAVPGDDNPLLRRAYLPDFNADPIQAQMNRKKLLRKINVGLNGDLINNSDDPRWDHIAEQATMTALRFKYAKRTDSPFSVLGMLGVYTSITEVEEGEEQHLERVISPTLFIASHLLEVVSDELAAQQDTTIIDIEPENIRPTADGEPEEPTFHEIQKMAAVSMLLPLLLDSDRLPNTTLWERLFQPDN